MECYTQGIKKFKKLTEWFSFRQSKDQQRNCLSLSKSDFTFSFHWQNFSKITNLFTSSRSPLEVIFLALSENSLQHSLVNYFFIQKLSPPLASEHWSNPRCLQTWDLIQHREHRHESWSQIPGCNIWLHLSPVRWFGANYFTFEPQFPILDNEY